MKKKTIIFIVIIVSAVISIFIWSISMPSKLIYFGGSSSVNPFMQIATKEFDEGKNYEVIYNSNGSQNGVRSVENGTYSVGMVSKEVKDDTLSEGSVFSNFTEVEPDLTVEENFNEFSNKVKTNNEINAVEFAIDAIVIMYNPPSWAEEYIDLVDFDFSDDSNHKEIVREIYSNPKYTWLNFLNDVISDKKIKKSINDKARLQINGGNDLIKPIARESGSGTRSSFDSLFGITDIDAGTANSNGSMITQLRDTSGSFGYVSYGFYKNSENTNLKSPLMNGKKLGQDGYVINQNNEQTDEPNEVFIKSDKYLLKRPFIMLFKSNNKKIDVVLEFIEFLISISDDEESAFTEEGLVPKIEYLSRDSINKNSNQ